MKKIEIEHRMAETTDLSIVLNKTIESALEEQKKTEASREDVSKILNDVFNFAKETLGSLQNVAEENREKFLESSIGRIMNWSQAEVDRIKLKTQLLQERADALQSVHNFITDRMKSYDSRMKAIERAADPNRDKKHPEKLSVMRAAKNSKNDVESVEEEEEL